MSAALAPSVRFGSPSGRWVLTLTVLSSSLVFLDATVVNVALPELGRDLDADVAGLQWTVNGYLVTLAALILLGGSLGDRYGRRRIFALGVAWFTAASALCAFAPTVETLVAARALQGVGGALLTPGSLAIIEATFHPDHRGRAIGAWSAFSGIAAALGPLVGGYLVDAVSWRAIFLLNVPVGAYVLWAAARHLPETRDPGAHGRPDLAGSVLASVGLGALTFALIQIPSDGVGSAPVVAGLAAGVMALVAFIWVERGARQPMLPLSIFSSRQFTGANLVTFVVYAALGGVFFLFVVFLQVALGYSAVAAGGAALPITGLLLVLSERIGALSQRVGPRLPLTAGPLVIAVGMVMMSGIDIGDRYVTDVLPAVTVFGLGLSLVVAPVTMTVLAAADPRQAGIASGVNNAVARTAGLVAVAALPLVAGIDGADYRDPQAMADAFRTGMLVFAGVAASGSLLAFATITNDVLDRAQAPEKRPCREALEQAPRVHCGVAGTPIHSAGAERSERAEAVSR